MKRFQLTLVFIIFSAITIGAGAAVMSALTASSAEKSLLRLTEDQSERDARFIATLVSQLLANDAPAEAVSPPVQGAPSDLALSPAFVNATLLIDAPTVLDALNIADLAIYDTTGARIWGSTIVGTMPDQLPADELSRAMTGLTDSGIVEDAIPAAPGAGNGVTADLVYTYIPLIGEESGATVQILGVSRPVPAGVAGLVQSSRSTVLKTTMASLGAVFLVLLAFVMAADVRIWRRNQAAIALEREQKAMLGVRNEELSQLSDAKSRFLSAVTHELATPLASITSFLDLVLRNRAGNLTGRQVEQLGIARRNGDQMSRLVTDLSDAARIERGRLEVLFEEFDCSRVVDDSVAAVSHRMMLREQTLITEISGDLGAMTADRGRLIQVLTNLLTNASKYSPKGSRIWLTVNVDSDALNVSVRDEGIGIARKDQEQLFTLFYRVDNEETRKVHGTGIGLLLVKEIVEAHRGKVRLESEPGLGTTVSFSVPLKPADDLRSLAPREEMTTDAEENRMAA